MLLYYVNYVTCQMASFHGLKDANLILEISNRQVDRVSEARPLGVISDGLDIVHASYGILRTLRKLTHFTDSILFYLRKRLAESLVSSRLGYCDSAYSPLPGYLLNILKTLNLMPKILFMADQNVLNDVRDLLKHN